jgi:hypothetical protein
MHKIFLLMVLIAIFGFGFYSAQGYLKNLKIPEIPATIKEIVVNTKESCNDECKKIIQDEVAKAVASASAKISAVNEAASVPIPKPLTSYISLDGTYSTTSTSWVDVPGAEVSFDLAADYSKGAKVAWEASLKVANANGTAYARIFDSTHGIAVDGSEVKVENKDNYQRVSSGYLNLWSGRNVYKVQVKSLNSFEVSYTGGKLRITH